MTRFNPLRFTTAALAIAAMSVLTVGCDSGSDTPADTPGDHADHGHGHGEHTLGTVEVEGRVVKVNISGELEAGEMYPHCHLTITGDPVDKMMIWIGAPSGEGALKGNVTGLGDHPVVDLEAPADLEDAVLGIEIEVGGETYTAFAPLAEDPEHHDDHDHADGDDHDHDGDGEPDH